jgi:hypothetical protein
MQTRNRVLRIAGATDSLRGIRRARGVRVGEKSPFPLNRPLSTRTFCKSLISPNVGLLPGPPMKSIGYERVWLPAVGSVG